MKNSGGELLLVLLATALQGQTPMPTITRLSPGGLLAGCNRSTFYVYGTNFVPNSVLRWNGNELPTLYVDSGLVILGGGLGADGEGEIPLAYLQVPGNAQVTVYNPPPSGGTSAPAVFEVGDAPVISSGGLVNAASYGGLAPGSIVSIFGYDLGTTTATAILTAGSLPTTLAGTSITLGDSSNPHSSIGLWPLFYVSPRQVNAQVPWTVGSIFSIYLYPYVFVPSSSFPTGATQNCSNQPLTLVQFAPAIFTANQTGSGQGAVLISGSGGLLAAPAAPGARPAMRGEYLEVYATGLGATFVDANGKAASPPANGAQSPNPPLSTVTKPTVTIGNVPAVVSFSGLAPGFVGLFQVNVQVPASVPSGQAVPLIVTIGGAVSNTVTIAVQ